MTSTLIETEALTATTTITGQFTEEILEGLVRELRAALPQQLVGTHFELPRVALSPLRSGNYTLTVRVAPEDNAPSETDPAVIERILEAVVQAVVEPRALECKPLRVVASSLKPAPSVRSALGLRSFSYAGSIKPE